MHVTVEHGRAFGAFAATRKFPKMRCVVLLGGLFAMALLRLRYMGLPDGRGDPDSFASFTLIMRPRDPAMFAPGAFRHYAECLHVGALRVVQDSSSSWNLTRAHLAVYDKLHGQPAHGRYSRDSLKQQLESAAVPPRFVGLLDARPSKSGAVVLVSDDLWINCDDMALAFDTWQKNKNGWDARNGPCLAR